VATATAKAVSASPVPISPAAEASPQPATVAPASLPFDPNDFSDTQDWEWNLADEAEGSDFEIDADATTFYMPQGNAVTFKAKALNGTPPFTFSWNFADGTPPATGEMVRHIFNVLGERDVVVTGKDASGATSIMNLGILVATVEDYAARVQLDPEAIEDYRKRFPAPSPAVTP
jgi:hypothetical protein